MILGSLKNTERVEKMNPAFKVFFDYVKENDLKSFKPGRIELDGKNLFILHSVYKGKMVEDTVLEAHSNYIDIQLVLEGVEAMGWKDLSDVGDVSIPYSEENDIVFYEGEADEIINVMPGQFLIFFPEDAHAPGIGEGSIRKVVAKIKI